MLSLYSAAARAPSANAAAENAAVTNKSPFFPWGDNGGATNIEQAFRIKIEEAQNWAHLPTKGAKP